MDSSLKDEISAIDDEIRALEDLILLQRRKADLLRRKSGILNSGHRPPDCENNVKQNGYPTISEPASQKVVKPMEISTSEDKVSVQDFLNERQHMYSKVTNLSVSDPKTLTFPVATSSTSSGSATTNEAEHNTNLESETATKSDGKLHHPKKWSVSDKLPSPRQTLTSFFSFQNHKQHEALTSIQRMSRITNDLANERNLLAWGRTAMACVRTSIVFTVFTGTTKYGEAALGIVTIGFISIGIYALAHGTQRFLRIRDALNDPDPTLEFKRISNLPMFFILFCVFTLVLVTQASAQWER